MKSNRLIISFLAWWLVIHGAYLFINADYYKVQFAAMLPGIFAP